MGYHIIKVILYISRYSMSDLATEITGSGALIVKKKGAKLRNFVSRFSAARGDLNPITSKEALWGRWESSPTGSGIL